MTRERLTRGWRGVAVEQVPFEQLTQRHRGPAARTSIRLTNTQFEDDFLVLSRAAGDRTKCLTIDHEQSAKMAGMQR